MLGGSMRGSTETTRSRNQLSRFNFLGTSDSGTTIVPQTTLIVEVLVVFLTRSRA